MNTNTQPAGSKQGEQREQLPQHVWEFLRITEELDNAVRAGDKKRIASARRALKVFYGTLTSDQQDDLQKFAEREVFGKVVEDQRSWIHRGFVRLMHVPHRVVGASAEPIAKFTGETIRLIILTLGWTIGGIALGVRDAVRGVMRKAA